MGSFIETKRCTRAFSEAFRAWGTALLLVAAAPCAGKVVDRILATVNDDIILQSDVERFLEKSKSKSFQEMYAGVDPAIFRDARSALQFLIEERLVDQQVKRLDLTVSDAEVSSQIRSIARRNRITENQLLERLRQLGTDIADYRAGIKRQLERRGLIDREIKPQLTVSDEQVRHFYERKQRESFGNDTEYKIAAIFVAAKPDRKKAEARARAIAEKARKEPEQFGTLARETSDDPATAKSDGLLGEFDLASLAPEFRVVAPKLKVGEVSQPIGTERGFFILKLLAVKTGTFDKLSREQREALRMELLGQEIERKMALWLDRKKQEAHIRLVDGLETARPSTPSGRK
jgi:peptidyl-prolyl cis-trans isomerase SurA